MNEHIKFLAERINDKLSAHVALLKKEVEGWDPSNPTKQTGVYVSKNVADHFVGSLVFAQSALDNMSAAIKAEDCFYLAGAAADLTKVTNCTKFLSENHKELVDDLSAIQSLVNLCGLL